MRLDFQFQQPKRLGRLGTALTSTSPNMAVIAQAIQTQEGWRPGTLAYQNNNPGNLIYTAYYAQAYGAVPGAGGFSKFPDYQTGQAALMHQVQVDANAGMTIEDMMEKWAPATDQNGNPTGNNPQIYAQNVANALGVEPGASVLSVLGTADGVGTGTGQEASGDWGVPIVQTDGTDGSGAGGPDWATIGMVAGAVMILMVVAGD